MDTAERAGNRLENATVERLREIYQGALDTAIKRESSLLKSLSRIDKEAESLPSDWTEAQIKDWKRVRITEAINRSGASARISQVIASVGGDASDVIRDMMYEMYGINREYVTELISSQVDMSFAVFDERQLQTIVDEEMGSFTKVAFKNLENPQPIVRRLQNEFAQAALLGESQKQIIKRITNVAGQSTYGARRIAQTERVRVQSAARYDTMVEAADKGVIIEKEWSTKMDGRERKSHGEMDGKIVSYDQKFTSKDGEPLQYPGDPSGLPTDTINCRCVLIPRVRGVRR